MLTFIYLMEYRVPNGGVFLFLHILDRICCQLKIKKREYQWVDTSFLLRIGNKIPMKGDTETEFRAETKGWTI